ncbi:MAG: hypothetical protein JNM37_11995 [Rhodocyclaceae bacterium]|nr:hypothetical protein [Rhodocyclaceae bacterium]
MNDLEQLDYDLRVLIAAARRHGQVVTAEGIAAQLWSRVADGAEHRFVRVAAIENFTSRAARLLER